MSVTAEDAVVVATGTPEPKEPFAGTEAGAGAGAGVEEGADAGADAGAGAGAGTEPASTKTKRTELALHLAVWRHDTDRLETLLESEQHDLEQRDQAGNTALLLAYRLGHLRSAQLLIAAGADPKARLMTPDLGQWEGIHVAGLTGNPAICRTAAHAMLRRSDDQWGDDLATTLDKLESLPAFEMEMHWSFESWLPLVSRLLPDDRVRVWKRGSSVRIDTTLQGMHNLRWTRGHVSIIISGRNTTTPGEIWFMDRERKTVSSLRKAFRKPKDNQTQDWVNRLLLHKLKCHDFWSRETEITPVFRKEGWLWKAATDEHLVEAVGDHLARVYEVKDLKLTSFVHTPVLKELPLEAWWTPEYALDPAPFDGDAFRPSEKGMLPLIQRVRDAAAAVSKSDASALSGTKSLDTAENMTFGAVFGPDVPPPTDLASNTQSLATFKPTHVTVTPKTMTVQMWMSDTFPLSRADMLVIASCMARTGAHFDNFRRFFEQRFPKDEADSFPVKFTLPALPTITATVTFTSCVTGSATKLAPGFFEVPKDFEMDAFVDRSFLRQL